MTEEQQDKIFDSTDDGAESPAKPENDSQVEGRYRLSPLTLTVFRRENDNGVFRNYNLQRTYPKDSDGEEQEFGYTESLRPRDLRKAARLFEYAADDVQDLRKEAPGDR